MLTDVKWNLTLFTSVCGYRCFSRSYSVELAGLTSGLKPTIVERVHSNASVPCPSKSPPQVSPDCLTVQGTRIPPEVSYFYPLFIFFFPHPVQERKGRQCHICTVCKISVRQVVISVIWVDQFDWLIVWALRTLQSRLSWPWRILKSYASSQCDCSHSRTNKSVERGHDNIIEGLLRLLPSFQKTTAALHIEKKKCDNWTKRVRIITTKSLKIESCSLNVLM